MQARKLFLAGAVSILALAQVEPTNAACNFIPSVTHVGGTFTSLTRAPLPKGIDSFPYKGALGRLQQIYFVPGMSKTIRMIPDGVCVTSRAGAEPAVPPVMEDVDDVVALVVFDGGAGQESFVRAYANPATCEALTQLVSASPGGYSTTGEVLRKVRLLGECSNDGVRVAKQDSGVTALELPAPTPGELEPAKPLIDSHAIRVVVSQPGEVSARALAALLDEPVTKRCEEFCGDLREAGGLGCFDSLYALKLSLDGTASYEVDPIPCAVSMPASVSANDFKKHCEDAPNPDANLTPCDDAADELTMWRDDCGNLHIPFSWQSIRKDTSGNAVTRVVAGRSGAGRKRKAESPRIWVPGREFLGSTPIADPQGTAAGTSWRRPKIDVRYTSTAKEEFGMIGTVDQDDSIVHIVPRLRVSVFCDEGIDEACMGIEEGEVACVCDDRYAKDCACKPPDSAPARFFACEGGKFDGMPCTRHNHCNDGTRTGSCTRKPFCQEPASVWEEGGGPGSGTKCWVDDDCKVETVKHQCGYFLFDFADRKVAQGVVKLDAKIMQGAARKRRGACKDDPGTPCGNDGGGPKKPGACSSGDCRGYVLEAGKEATP